MKLKVSRLLILALAVSIGCVSCGKPTKRKIANESVMRAKLDGFAEEMKQLAADFPQKPFDLDLPTPLDPAPDYHIFDPFSNTAVIMVNQMEDVMHVWKAAPGELNLHTSIGMTNIFRDSYLSEEAEEGWREKLEAYLDVRYVVAMRTLKYVPPKIIEKNTFSGGTAVMLVALYDRQEKKWIYAGPVIALPLKQVQSKTKADGGNTVTLSEMKENNRNRIRKLVDEKLTKLTGGFFEFEPGAPKVERASASP